jgi:hypothetical protein
MTSPSSSRQQPIVDRSAPAAAAAEAAAPDSQQQMSVKAAVSKQLAAAKEGLLNATQELSGEAGGMHQRLLWQPCCAAVTPRALPPSSSIPTPPMHTRAHRQAGAV